MENTVADAGGVGRTDGVAVAAEAVPDDVDVVPDVGALGVAEVEPDAVVVPELLGAVFAL